MFALTGAEIFFSTGPRFYEASEPSYFIIHIFLNIGKLCVGPHVDKGGNMLDDMATMQHYLDATIMLDGLSDCFMSRSRA